ncbi:hypothetical protein G6F57_006099 [Rhizopus arrhizus]|uniref:Acyl-coenzyme A oxidase n=1 Tax=Rhizopus oryzae TaxID=64495 RepID=A0A9P7BU07_RHIOR|nr:hypothetical protein G6F30_006077 [Rhizopus arrhizus]KAG1424340.1 hypothetical protein G6F58_002436 [Rhizopus delemar]KAG0982337.1 hypothetical protein G6F29_006372 [Rhizopus arrhizus]KAG0993217.1 hypothetical protein G6F28_006907 [Rhizopus arrhizus]KAG1008554.1 hypothetical protein G6F27_006396 [Rhizopus arrhizus]
MSIDLEEARKKASFPIDKMNELLLGNSFLQVKKIKPIVENEPMFNLLDLHFKSRQEQLAYALQIAKRMIEIVEEHRLDQQEQLALMIYVDMLTPLGLHYSAFMSVIEAQGTQEQVDKWYAAAKRHAIIGCYAQTELSHGSNVAGLRTVAVFDAKTDEFIIHSPDLTAAKWWVGGLGVASTHAVVQAQLIIANKSYGPHLFIVPVRSPVDLKPYPGVTVGDIGPKAYGGFATVDNGFVLFDHVRIPRNNMLMKFARVTQDGRYLPPVHDKLSYGGMVKLRVDIVNDAAVKLAKAVTIASRYCTVRRQFGGPTIETQVISYSSVQHRLIPLLATTYSIWITSQDLYDQFGQLTEQLEKNNAHMLPEVHATSCALKSWCTRQSSDGIETCRKALGGHGYSIFSGVSELFATYVPSNTYEGDNYVLSQQVARFLLKQLKEPSNFSSASYLKKDETVKVESAKALLDPQVQLRLYQTRAARLVKRLSQQLTSGRSWSDVNMECWEVNLAHAEYLIVRSMVHRVTVIESSELAPIMKRLLDLFCLHYLCNSVTFLSTSTVSPSDLDLIQQEYRQAISDLSHNLIPLTDAFGYTDRQLNTALGRGDGRAYEALWEAAQKNPINCDEVQRTRLANLVMEILHRDNNLEYIQSAKL